LQINNKTKHPKKEGGEKKGTRWKDPSPRKKKEKPPMGANPKGNMNKSSTQTP
jgi:hypothetical protein